MVSRVYSERPLPSVLHDGVDETDADVQFDEEHAAAPPSFHMCNIEHPKEPSDATVLRVSNPAR
jgi:hypothetical protein